MPEYELDSLAIKLEADAQALVEALDEAVASQQGPKVDVDLSQIEADLQKLPKLPNVAPEPKLEKTPQLKSAVIPEGLLNVYEGLYNKPYFKTLPKSGDEQILDVISEAAKKIAMIIATYGLPANSQCGSKFSVLSPSGSAHRYCDLILKIGV